MNALKLVALLVIFPLLLAALGNWERQRAEEMSTVSYTHLSEENSVSNYLGHQWTASDDRGVKDLIVLGRFSKNKSGLLLMTRFVLLGILFGATGNGLWEYFPKCMSNYSCDDCVTSASKMAAFIIIGVFLMLIEPAIDMTKKFASRLHRKIKSLLPYRS